MSAHGQLNQSEGDRPMKTICGLALVALLGFAHVGAADCSAWVLWLTYAETGGLHGTTPPTRGYTVSRPLRAFTAQQECLVAQAQQIQEARQAHVQDEPMTPPPPDGVAYLVREQGRLLVVVQVSYTCFPATVDARAK